MKLALGTAQFGLDYGVSNTLGKVCLEEVKKILALAKSNNINTLDTALAYGNSQSVLGETNLSKKFNIVSKIPSMKGNSIDVEQYIDTSLQQLNISKIGAVLFHQVDDIIASPVAKNRLKALVKQKEKGKIFKVGISVYKPEQLAFCIKHYPIDIVQLPLNCLDQRFINASWINKLSDDKIEIHCRSIFLQGLLLMKLDSLPPYFTPYRKYFQRFLDTAKQLSVSPLALALAIGHQHEGIDKMVVGCCSVEQLSEIINAYIVAKEINEDLSTLVCEDENLIIPSNWH